MVRMVRVVPREDYLLDVELDDGSRVMLSLKSRLGTVRFGMLSDPDFFNKATTDGSYVRWGNTIEISIKEVFQLHQKERGGRLYDCNDNHE